ncbi:MAG: amidohydrolase [Planctomycetota bacterium]|nr:amidohydrolase [Planctomycetota bacterium]
MRILLMLFVFNLSPLMVLAQEPPEATEVYINGRVHTVDAKGATVTAFAVKDGRFLAVGANEDVLLHASKATRVIDLDGKTVIPGLIDSHVHSTGAAVYEYDHVVPPMNEIADVLAYIKDRVELLEDDQWILMSQVFITRLKEQRFPTRQEMDSVAPNNPVVFRTGPDSAVNSRALELSGIDDNFVVPEDAVYKLERDDHGKLTGVLRSGSSLLKYEANTKSPGKEERIAQLKKLIHDYNQVGITSVSDRNASDQALTIWRSLYESGDLSVRVFLYYSMNANATPEAIRSRIDKAAADPLHQYNPHLWLRGVKVFLDGGMLTGSAFMRKPWGVSEIYSIRDPDYRGMRYIEQERLYQFSKLMLEKGFQMTAHSVGDGAVHALLDAYQAIDENDFKVAEHRPCITHCNFMSLQAIQTMAELGVVADLQPAWLYMEGKTLLRQFGQQRTEYFQPYKTIFENGVVVGGGSDHMQRIGSRRSVNPYNPFLGMWVTLKRQPRYMTDSFHPEQIITRQQALKLYTLNNAFLTFEEKEKGSIEPGKLADFVILDRDIMTVDLVKVKDTQVLQTYLGGALVYDQDQEYNSIERK